MELALITPLMVLIVMGFLDLGRAYRTQIRLENAAREGAALAQLFPNNVSCPSKQDINDRVRTEDPAITSTPDFLVEVSRIEDDGSAVPLTGCSSDVPPQVEVAVPGDRVKVEVSATFSILTPMVAKVVGDSIKLTGDAEVRVQGRVGS